MTDEKPYTKQEILDSCTEALEQLEQLGKVTVLANWRFHKEVSRSYYFVDQLETEETGFHEARLKMEKAVRIYAGKVALRAETPDES